MKNYWLDNKKHIPLSKRVILDKISRAICQKKKLRSSPYKKKTI
jgi:hypothetical protein